MRFFGIAQLTLLSLLLASAGQADFQNLIAKKQRLSQPLPKTFDRSLTKSGQWFKLSARPLTPAGVLPLSTVHEWTLKLSDRQGRPLTGVRIEVRGEMPQHGHPFPTEPRVLERNAGNYLVRGIAFQMPGWWKIELALRKGARAETFRFDLLVGALADPERNELEQLRGLWIGSLPELKPAPDPGAIELGRVLFADTSLSRDGKVACATCHRADRAMSEGAVRNVTFQGPRKVPSLIGVAWQHWFFWDGRKDSLWSQALAPIENPNEYNMTASEFVERARERHGRLIETAFGSARKPVPEAFADLGRAIAAYEATLRPGPSPFDRYVERKLGLKPVDPERGSGTGSFGACEQLGLKTFLGKGRCVQCHFGARLENGAFHNTGVPTLPEESGSGRFSGIRAAKTDPHRCQGKHCLALETAAEGTTSLSLAFKTPSLRNVALTAPYMHNGSLKTLEDVVRHYESAPTNSEGSELFPLELSPEESRGLSCFLRSLTQF